LVYRGASNKLDWQKVEWGKLTPDWFYVSSLGGDLAMLTKIVRHAQKEGIRIAFNPGSREIAAGEKLKAFLPHVEVLLLNRQEAAKLTHHEFANREEILKDAGKLGARVVAVTEGKKGASLISGKVKLNLPAARAKTVEETGAGDAFGAGLVAGIIKGFSLEQALKLALANGASVTEHFGPKEGLIFEPEIKERLD